MNPLSRPRTEINKIDRELIALLARRMDAIREIGAYKGENEEIPVHDEHREHRLFEFWAAEGPQAGLPVFFLGRVLREILSHSRRDQEQHLRPSTTSGESRLHVGYQGTPGSPWMARGIEGELDTLSSSRIATTSLMLPPPSPSASIRPQAPSLSKLARRHSSHPSRP